MSLTNCRLIYESLLPESNKDKTSYLASIEIFWQATFSIPQNAAPASFFDYQNIS